MKQLFLLLIVGLFFAFKPVNKLKTGAIIIELVDLKCHKGEVEVSLYNDDKTFLRDKGALVTKRQKVQNGKIQVVFEDIPFGAYAAVSYHDLNENHQFDRNFIGIPKEPVAVSRLYKKRFRKPCFQDAKIDFNRSNMVVKMRFVKY